MAHKYPVVPVTSKPTALQLRATHATYQNSGKALATSVNLRNIFGVIEDQGQYGACTAFASLQFRMALRRQAGLPVLEPAFFANYYEERWDEGSVTQDSGATITESVNVLEKYGAMPANDDPYTPDDFAKAPPSDWQAGFQLDPAKVQQVNQSTLLADTLDALNNGHPVLFGFTVYDELESAQMASTGVLTMPANPQKPIGGHAVNVIGYDQSKQMLLILNQWGSGWGIHNIPTLAGCFWMPYAYYTAYASDAWVGFPDDTNQPPSPIPVPSDKYVLQVGTDKPAYTIGDNADVWVTLTNNGQDLLGQIVTVHISDGETGPVPIAAPGKNGFPWNTTVPGTYTFTATWNTLTATAQATYSPEPPKPQPTPTPSPPTPSQLKGFDIYEKTQVVDLKQAQKARFAFAIAKAVEGATYHDSTFVANYKAIADAGMIRGSYCYARPKTSSALGEANSYVDTVTAAGGFDGSIPPILDMEDDGGLSNADLVAWCQTWGNMVTQKTGKRPIFYVSSDFLKQHGLQALSNQFDLWIADYATAPDIGTWSGGWKLWQTTDKGSVPGITGNVDVNVFNGTIDDLKALCEEMDGLQATPAKVKVNGAESQAYVVNGDTYINWSALQNVGSLNKQFVNSEWLFTVVAANADNVKQAQALITQALNLLK